MAGRGRPKLDDPAHNVLSVRFTDAERDLVKEAAELAEVPVGVYVRAKAVAAAKRAARPPSSGEIDE